MPCDLRFYLPAAGSGSTEKATRGQDAGGRQVPLLGAQALHREYQPPGCFPIDISSRVFFFGHLMAAPAQPPVKWKSPC